MKLAIIYKEFLKIGDTDVRKVYVSTFSQLIGTVEKRLF
jgi:hypothetical protein